jgi:hypothetical protein
MLRIPKPALAAVPDTSNPLPSSETNRRISDPDRDNSTRTREAPE